MYIFLRRDVRVNYDPDSRVRSEMIFDRKIASSSHSLIHPDSDHRLNAQMSQVSMDHSGA
jgi:hypothetical protein